jgi:hypothetical protein
MPEKEKTKPKLQTWDECDVIQVCWFVWGWLEWWGRARDS